MKIIVKSTTFWNSEPEDPACKNEKEFNQVESGLKKKKKAIYLTFVSMQIISFIQCSTLTYHSAVLCDL